MNVRTTSDVEALDLKIYEELGIDVKKYRNEEVVEDFVELLIFPRYVVNWVMHPILISLVLFIAGFFFLNLVHIEYFLYLVIGFVLFLTTGILFSLVFLTWKMKSDIWGIVDYSLNIMKSAVQDLSKVNHQITVENRKDVLGLLFKGVIHIVTIPLLSKVISEKVPLVGSVANKAVKKALTLISDKVKFDEANLTRELDKDSQQPSPIEAYSNSITTASNSLEKVTNISFGVVQFPLKLAFFITLFFLVIFLYLIN